jgi:hypothetical protein
MKPRLFTSILLFISAYSPLCLLLAVRDIDFKCNHWFNHPIAIFILLGVTASSIVLLFIILHLLRPGNMVVRLQGVKNKSVDIIGYTIPYMVAFFGIDLAKPDDIISLVIFLGVLFMLTVSSKAIFLNPILIIAGYGLYEIEYEFHGMTLSDTVISRMELRRGEEFHLKSLTRFLYLIKQEDGTTDEDAGDTAPGAEGL